MKTFDELILELSLSRASAFASMSHSGQTRKSSGKPYVVHPTAVYKLLKGIGVKDKNVLVSAMLHDTLEDSSATKNNLEREFNKDVARIVKGLSSSKKGIDRYGKPKYLAHKMVKMDNDVLTIKLADRWHNIQDMDSMPKDKAKSYLLQTKYILDTLHTDRNMSKDQKKIVRKIEKTMYKFRNISMETN